MEEQSTRERLASATELEQLDLVELEICKVRPANAARIAELLWRARRDLLKARGDEPGALEADLTSALLSTDLTHRIEQATAGFFEAWVDGGGIITRAAARASKDLFARYWAILRDDRQSPIVRSKLGLALWELHAIWKRAQDDRCPRKPEVVTAILPQLFEAARALSEDADSPADGAMAACPYWQAAAFLGCLLKDFPSLAPAMEPLRLAIRGLEHDAPHWALALARAEIHIAGQSDPGAQTLVSGDRLRELLACFDRLDFRLREIGPLDVAATLVDDRTQVERLLGSPLSTIDIARRRAGVREHQANNHPSKMVRSNAWVQVATIYQNAGLTVEAGHAKQQSRILMQEAQADGEFMVVVNELEEDLKMLDQALDPLFDGAGTAEIVLQRVALSPLTRALVDPDASVRESGSVLANLATQIRIVGDRIVESTADREAGNDSLERRRVMAFEVTLACARTIPRIMQRLDEGYGSLYEKAFQFIGAAPCTGPEDRTFLELGLKYLQAGQAVAAVHILVPRVEQLVRRHLLASHVDATVLRDGSLQERTFGELLRVGEKVLPAWLARLYRVTLTEDWGLNLRNKIAHGLATETDCRIESGYLVMYLLLTIAMQSWRARSAPGHAAVEPP